MQCTCKTCWLDPWVRKIPWRRAWQPTLVFVPGESHGQSSLAGCSPQGPTESDMTEALSMAWQRNATVELSSICTMQLHPLCLSLHYSVFLGCLMPSFSFSSVSVLSLENLKHHLLWETFLWFPNWIRHPLFMFSKHSRHIALIMYFNYLFYDLFES